LGPPVGRHGRRDPVADRNTQVGFGFVIADASLRLLVATCDKAWQGALCGRNNERLYFAYVPCGCWHWERRVC
jgi:hypothetical protein